MLLEIFLGWMYDIRKRTTPESLTAHTASDIHRLVAEVRQARMIRNSRNTRPA